MRILGMVLSLGAIVWVLYQGAGGGEAETVIPAAQQESLDRAKAVEKSMQAALQQRMDGAEAKEELE